MINNIYYFMIALFNLLDWYITVIVLNNGGIELNPLIEPIFNISYSIPLFLKFIPICIGIITLSLIYKYINNYTIYEKYNKHTYYIFNIGVFICLWIPCIGVMMGINTYLYIIGVY